MTGIPRVTGACAEAVLSKAVTHDDPTEFAMETLAKFHTEQPELAGMIGYVVGTLIGGEEVIESDDPKISDFTERQLTMIYAIVGLLYGSIKSQIEANELEEVFS